ncbi:MAG: hypothetical protein ACFCGT_25800 [Sandaracinaceae bacterium]
MEGLFRDRVVSPAIRLVRARAATDPELLALLDQLSVAASTSQLEPQAAAFRGEGGRPAVQVDVGYLAFDRFYLDLATTIALRETGWGGLAPPDLGAVQPRGACWYTELELTPDPRTDDSREAYDTMRFTIALDMVAWTTLHEVAHHRLGHLEPGGSRPTAELQQEELDADRWAFERMYATGYRLCTVRSYLAGRAAAEARWRQLGILGEVASASHPSFAERLDRLDVVMRTLPAAAPEWETLQFALPGGYLGSVNIASAPTFDRPRLVGITIAGGAEGELANAYGALARDREGPRLILERTEDRLLELRLIDLTGCQPHVRLRGTTAQRTEEVRVPAFVSSPQIFGEVRMPGDVPLEQLVGRPDRLREYMATLLGGILEQGGHPREVRDRIVPPLIDLIEVLFEMRLAQLLEGSVTEEEMAQAMLGRMMGIAMALRGDPEVMAALETVTQSGVLRDIERAGDPERPREERARRMIELLFPEIGQLEEPEGSSGDASPSSSGQDGAGGAGGGAESSVPPDTLARLREAAPAAPWSTVPQPYHRWASQQLDQLLRRAAARLGASPRPEELRRARDRVPAVVDVIARVATERCTPLECRGRNAQPTEPERSLVRSLCPFFPFC